MNKVLIIDTSMLCCWLQVPGKETCGKTEDQWDFQRVNQELQKEIASGSTLVLPLATIIETGNHIAQANGDRFSVAQKLASLIIKAAESLTPWAAFTDQSVLWESDGLKRLAEEFPRMASEHDSIGDVTIKTVADYYAKMGRNVEIFTGDARLKGYQPAIVVPQPRRRKK